jgi:16S rRNA (cytosine967-C5)-methyltransferase
MAEVSARQTAQAALRLWRKEKRFADSIMSGLLAKADFAPSDRAFALELFYGALRNLTLLDFWIGCLRASRIESNVRDILRLGLYQLFLLKTPEHAAVHETVSLALHKQRPLVNGILRAATRRRSELFARADAQPLFVRTSHPQFLVERWQQNFGVRHAEELCRWNNRPAPVYARINRLKIDPKAFLQLYPDSRPVPGNLDLVEFNTFPATALDLGHCYIQDPSTVIACQLLDPKPGEKILDACAAPGGKTSYLAQIMQNATIGRFDRVLVDAPCTNTGVIRRRIDVRWRLQAENFSRMPSKQFIITRAVLRLLKPGGVLVYSTCSLEPEENEELVCCLLAKLPSLRLEEARDSLPFRDGFDGAFAGKFNVAVAV